VLKKYNLQDFKIKATLIDVGILGIGALKDKDKFKVSS
jgi:hypothetical protein